MNRVVGRATYSLCTCRYFASRILMASRILLTHTPLDTSFHQGTVEDLGNLQVSSPLPSAGCWMLGWRLPAWGFFTINAVLSTFGNSCSLVKENLVDFWMTLELALGCPALKEWAPVPAEHPRFEGMGLDNSVTVCLNGQTLDFQVKVKWVYSLEKMKKANIQKLCSF